MFGTVSHPTSMIAATRIEGKFRACVIGSVRANLLSRALILPSRLPRRPGPWRVEVRSSFIPVRPPTPVSVPGLVTVSQQTQQAADDVRRQIGRAQLLPLDRVR